MGAADGASALSWSGLADFCLTVVSWGLSDPLVFNTALLAITGSLEAMLTADAATPATFTPGAPIASSCASFSIFDLRLAAAGATSELFGACYARHHISAMHEESVPELKGNCYRGRALTLRRGIAWRFGYGSWAFFDSGEV